MSDTTANDILAGLQSRLGARWDAITPDDRAVIAAVAVDYAELQARAQLTDPNDAAAVQHLARELAFVEASLADIQSVAANEIRGTFMDAVRDVGAKLLAGAGVALPVLLQLGLASVGVPPGLSGAIAAAVAVPAPAPAPPPEGDNA